MTEAANGANATEGDRLDRRRPALDGACHQRSRASSRSWPGSGARPPASRPRPTCRPRTWPRARGDPHLAGRLDEPGDVSVRMRTSRPDAGRRGRAPRDGGAGPGRHQRALLAAPLARPGHRPRRSRRAGLDGRRHLRRSAASPNAAAPRRAPSRSCSRPAARWTRTWPSSSSRCSSTTCPSSSGGRMIRRSGAIDSCRCSAPAIGCWSTAAPSLATAWRG